MTHAPKPGEDQFVKGLRGMISRTARKLAFCEDIADDLFQEGCIGALMAYRKHYPDIRCKATTFAYPRVVGRMKTYLIEKAHNINTPHSAWNRQERPPVTVTIDGMDFPMQCSMEVEIEARVYVDQLSKILTPTQAALVNAIVKNDKTLVEYAKAKGVPRGAAYRLAKRIGERIGHRLLMESAV